jgi:hypothetical protein
MLSALEAIIFFSLQNSFRARASTGLQSRQIPHVLNSF